ncbi:MAG: dihydroneopterin aldolase [Alicyclobacillaceae bacterium]|nr:dihydroneopterin aldolase [Alicyclobacillaceae bacterium]
MKSESVRDEIRLRGLQFFGYHGVLPEETVTGQRFVVNLALRVDLRRAGNLDAVEETVDYGQVYRTVEEIVTSHPPKRLIEAVAESIATAILERFATVALVKVEVEKPGAPIPGIFDSVSVCIERSATKAVHSSDRQ